MADLRYDDSADDAAHQVVLDKIGECEDLVRQYARANGFRSQEVRSAIDEWSRAFLADLGRRGTSCATGATWWSRRAG